MNGWKNGRVYDLIESLESGVCVNGTDNVPSEEEVAVLKVSSVSYCFFNPQSCKAIIDKKELKRAKGNPRINEIIISRSNTVEEGSIGLLEHCEKGIVSPIYVVFEALKEKVHSLYLYKLLKTDIYRHIFQVSTSSSVDRRGSLRWGEFTNIKVLIPSLEEQKQISETLSSDQHEIDLLKQLASKYKTQKRGLMQKMLTGEWRVKPDVVKTFEEAKL